MVAALKKLLVSMVDKRYYPDLYNLFGVFCRQNISMSIERGHRHNTDYNRIGVLFYDLWSEEYPFPLYKRNNEASRMVKHLEATLFRRFSRWYEPKREISKKALEAAHRLVEVLYCSEEDIPRYIGYIDKDVVSVAAWRLSHQSK